MSAAPLLNQLLDSNPSFDLVESNDFDHTFAEIGRKPLLHLHGLKHGRMPRKETGSPEDGTINKSGIQPADDLPQPVIVPKASTSIHNKFVPLQKWEGVVLKKGEDSFFARLVDLTSQTVDEEAEFALEEVPPSDVDLFEEGAVFYWDIGYLDQTNGQRSRTSSLRFRRLPSWSEGELNEGESRAAELQRLLGSD